MIVKFVNWDRSYKNLKPEIDFAMQRVLSLGNLILREDVEEFEENLAKFVGTKYAVALNSGTDALKLVYESVGLGSSYWSISIPSYTFKATAGATKQVHPDISINTYDLGELPEDSDIAVVAHIAGELFPIPKVNYFLIEDAAQALGALKNPNSFAQTWSFYPAKILGAFGDAGAVTTNDEKVAEYIREARNHFKKDNRDFGINSRMDNLQAAILNVKFKYLPMYLERRKQVAEKYLQELKGLYYWPHSTGVIDLNMPNNQKGRVYQDFIINAGIKRNELYEFLKKEGVETMKNEYPWTPEYPKLPLATKYEAETLRIPCNAEILDEEVEQVIIKIKEFYGL